MAGAATIAGSTAVVKELYPEGDVPWTVYSKNPEVAWIEKDEKFVGQPARIPVQTEMTMGASAQFANAQANIQQSAYYAFLVTRVEDFSIARIDNHALAAVDGDEGGLVDLWSREIDSAMKHAVWQMGKMIFRSGTGSIGVVGAVATNLLTLATPADVVNFGVGMTVNAAATDGGALVNTAAKEVIAGIDRVNGVLKSTSVNWTTNLTGVAAGYFLSRDGDGQNNGATPFVLTGMQGWIPGGTLSSPPGALFGVTRSVDPTGLAGQLFNAAGYAAEEALIEAIARADVEGATSDTLLCHPRQKAALLKSLESKTKYNKESGPGTGNIGFKDVHFESDLGPVKIIGTRNCPFNTAFLVQEDSWYLGSIGKAPRIQDFDTLEFVRVNNADQLEVRIYAYYQEVCRAPRWQVQISNFCN